MDTYGLSARLMAELAGVHIDTARRWKRKRRIPPAYIAIVQLKLDGDLGVLAQDWRGWRVLRGELVTPEGWSVRPGEIRSIPYRAQQLSALEVERSTWRTQQLAQLRGAHGVQRAILHERARELIDTLMRLVDIAPQPFELHAHSSVCAAGGENR
jgi:Phage protein